MKLYIRGLLSGLAVSVIVVVACYLFMPIHMGLPAADTSSLKNTPISVCISDSSGEVQYYFNNAMCSESDVDKRIKRALGLFPNTPITVEFEGSLSRLNLYRALQKIDIPKENFIGFSFKTTEFVYLEN
jgi:hypothetical protein